MNMLEISSTAIRFSDVAETEKSYVRRVKTSDDFYDLSADELAKVPKCITDDIRKKILWGVYNDYGKLLKVTELRSVERLTDSDEDAAAFQRLYLRSLQEQPQSFGSTYDIESKKTLEEVKAFLRANHVVGAKYAYDTADGKTEEALIGMASLAPGEGVNSHTAMLGKVYVHPAHRMKSIARTLIENILDHADKTGVEQVHLITTESNKHNVDFYTRLGFVPGEIIYRAAKIDDQYYNWVPMRLSMQKYRSERRLKAAADKR